MTSRLTATAEYEHRHGANQELVETVIEIRMSKANAAKFAKRIAAATNGQDDLYAAYEIDGQTVKFANGLTNEGYQLDDIIADELAGTIGNYRFTK